MNKDTRKQRLESLLQREVATCLTTELRDPRIGFITITRVELSADLQMATAYYTVLGDADLRLTQKALRGAAGHVQRTYAPHVHTRLLPRLRFRHDEQEVKRHHMDQLIAEARASDPDHGLDQEDHAEPQAPDDD